MSVFKVIERVRDKKKTDVQTVKNYLIQECIKHTVYPEVWLKKQTIKSLRWLANRRFAQLKSEVQA